MEKGLTLPGLKGTMSLAGKVDETRADGLLERISKALADAGIADGYTRLQAPEGGKGLLYVCHEDGMQRTYLNVEVTEGRYSLQQDRYSNEPRGNARSPFEADELDGMGGVTTDHNEFVQKLHYIFAQHYPTAFADGRLLNAMERFKRPEAPKKGFMTAGPEGQQAFMEFDNP